MIASGIWNVSCADPGGLEFGPRSPHGMRSAPLFVQMPHLPTKAGMEGVRIGDIAKWRAPIGSPIRNPRNPW
eukprot:9675604-Alexandrium_andersonii.AAC.1